MDADLTNFDPQVKDVITQAIIIMAACKHEEVQPVHLLFGFVILTKDHRPTDREDDFLYGILRRKRLADVKELRQLIKPLYPQTEGRPIVYNEKVQLILEDSVNWAKMDEDGTVLPLRAEHVLLSLLESGDQVLMTLLHDLKVDVPAIISAAYRVRAEHDRKAAALDGTPQLGIRV